MSVISTYMANKLLDHSFGKTSYTMPTIYLALSTANPGDDGSGLTEPSSGGYARLTMSGSDMNAASSKGNSNTTDLTFTPATGSWGTITHIAVMDADTGGHVLFYDTIRDSGGDPISKAVSSGDVITISAGNLTAGIS